uniref:Relaxase (TraA) n=1 Tax=Ochrobactrum sp. LM19 TaxID=1449781 RepID=A0A0D5A135_9HYPH|nr:LPD7 domain-containing protein [Ochrobactrum sp. LM19]AJW30025.1 relaxase (TraA) [Ochrobactrum sp. LM19]
MVFAASRYRSKLADALMEVRRRQEAMASLYAGGGVSGLKEGQGTESKKGSNVLPVQLRGAAKGADAGQSVASAAKPIRGRPPVYGTAVLSSGVAHLSGLSGSSTSKDDEWRRRRVGAAGALRGQRMRGRGLVSFETGLRAGAFVSLRDQVRSALGQTVGDRLVTRVGLAAGGQAAVVKVASFGGGAARVGALMRYQSQGGSLSLERQDGSLVTGVHAISDVARQWSEGGRERAPTKDVLRVVLTVGEGTGLDPDDIDIERRLGKALAGHRFAYAVEAVAGGGVRVEAVLSAAARPIGGGRKGERIFDNRKSLDRLEETIDRAFGWNAEVEFKGFAHGVEGVARYLGQLTRTGSREAHSVRLEGRTARIAGFTRLNGHDNNLAEARRWERDLRSQAQRDAMHVILSSKPGTDGDAFLDAARSMLARTFPDHDYVFAMHRDRGHLHVHAAVRMQSSFGDRLHPNIADFRRWREMLAEEARARGIAMFATHDRFEQAHHPSYRMSDIQRYQRGVATPAIQRRVEAVRNRDVYVPVRPEGRQAAYKAAAGWQRLETLVQAQVHRDGLARVLLPDVQASAVQGLSLRDNVLNYRNRAAVVIQRLEEREAVAIYARVIAEREQEAIEHSLNENASTHAGRNPALKQEEHDMAELKTMRAAYARIDDQLDEMEKLMPKEDLETFRKARRQVEVATREALGEQDKIEQLRGGFEGQDRRHVRPVAMFELGAFDLEQQPGGDTIRYRHRTDTGKPGHIAFVDQGAKVEVHDWTNREAVLAAMQLASDKWGAINVTGSRRYKAMVVELAAEHGISVANPELQGRLDAERERLSRKAEKAPGFVQAGTDEIKAGPSTPLQQPVTQPATQAGPLPSAMTGQNNERPPVLFETDSQFEKLGSVQQAIERDWRLANEIGVVSEIEAYAADRLTAAQTAALLGDRLQRVDEISAANNEQVFARQNREQLVRSVRNKLAIPSLEEKAEFEAWLSRFHATTATRSVDGKTDEPKADNDKLVVSDPYNEAAVLASLMEANRKWGAVQLESKDEQFLVVAVKVAAENNIPVRNGELQALYRAEQERVAYEAHARPGLVNPVAREEEGRDAWNKVTIAAIQFAEAADRDHSDEAFAHYRAQLRSAARLALYGNAYLTDLATRESTLGSELMLVEAEEELRQAEAKARLEGEAKTQSVEPGKAASQQQASPDSEAGARSVTGLLLQTGQALYRESEKESMTPYAEVRTDEGRIERLWGVTMPKAIIDSQARNGDRVTIVLDGRESVEKLVPVIDEKTGVKTYEKREVERNVWTVTVHRPEEGKGQSRSVEEQTRAEDVQQTSPHEIAAEHKPVQSGRTGRFEFDKAEAERSTGKVWDELSVNEKIQERIRQKSIHGAPENRPTQFHVDKEEAERSTGKTWGELSMREKLQERTRQKNLVEGQQRDEEDDDYHHE